MKIFEAFGMKAAPRGCYIEDAFSLKNSKAMKGILSIFILMHHAYVILHSFKNYNGPLQIFEHVGVIIVGFFFFCSGYGLITSLHNKQNYLQGFIKKRVLTVLVSFFICNYAYMITTLLMGTNYAMDDLLYAFFGMKLLNSQMWFAVEIMILYIIFYLVFRFVKQEKAAYTVMTCLVVTMMIGSLFLGHDHNNYGIGNWFHGEWWYNTSFIFIIGMFAARFKTKLVNIIKKKYLLWLGLSVVGCILLGSYTNHLLKHKGYWVETKLYNGYLEKFETLAFQLPMVLCCVAVILLVMMKVCFYNKALEFLGKISFEIILINGVFSNVYLGLSSYSVTLYVALVILSTILAAMIIYRIKLWVLDRNE